MTTARGLRPTRSLMLIASFRTTSVASPTMRKCRAMLNTNESKLSIMTINLHQIPC